jgi:hypothetical protein
MKPACHSDFTFAARAAARILSQNIVPAVTAALLLDLPMTHAASATWAGATDGLWATSTNRSITPVPGTGDTATFAGTWGATLVSLGSGITINAVLFDTAGAAAYTIGSGAVNSQPLTCNNIGGVINAAIVLGMSVFRKIKYDQPKARARV